MKTCWAGLAVSVLLLASAGCGGPRAAGPAAERPTPPSTTARPEPDPPTLEAGALPAPGRVALRYAAAARSWTPETYRAQYRRQLLLSTGALRSAVKRAPPTREQLAGYRADKAYVEATAISATSLMQSATQARYRLMLDESSVAAGQTVRARATYLVELRREGGRWLVTAFTIQP
ncbi:MAG: hypothetical protein ACLGI5_18145 [Thermoleophilia bacterium]